MLLARTSLSAPKRGSGASSKRSHLLAPGLFTCPLPPGASGFSAPRGPSAVRWLTLPGRDVGVGTRRFTPPFGLVRGGARAMRRLLPVVAVFLTALRCGRFGTPRASRNERRGCYLRLGSHARPECESGLAGLLAACPAGLDMTCRAAACDPLAGHLRKWGDLEKWIGQKPRSDTPLECPQ